MEVIIRREGGVAIRATKQSVRTVRDLYRCVAAQWSDVNREEMRFEKGNCWQGERCLFRHGAGDKPPPEW
eukprot:gene5198-23369_t